jgi:hypothetical protein
MWKNFCDNVTEQNRLTSLSQIKDMMLKRSMN